MCSRASIVIITRGGRKSSKGPLPSLAAVVEKKKNSCFFFFYFFLVYVWRSLYHRPAERSQVVVAAAAAALLCVVCVRCSSGGDGPDSRYLTASIVSLILRLEARFTLLFFTLQLPFNDNKKKGVGVGEEELERKVDEANRKKMRMKSV